MAFLRGVLFLLGLSGAAILASYRDFARAAKKSGSHTPPRRVKLACKRWVWVSSQREYPECSRHSRRGSVTLGGKQHSVVFLHPRAASPPRVNTLGLWFFIAPFQAGMDFLFLAFFLFLCYNKNTNKKYRRKRYFV